MKARGIQAGSGNIQHTGSDINTGHLIASLRQGQGQTPGAHAEFQDGSAGFLGERKEGVYILGDTTIVLVIITGDGIKALHRMPVHLLEMIGS